MTEPLVELTVAGTTKVVAFACGACRIVAPSRPLAISCCAPRACETCGAEPPARWLKCAPCRARLDAERERALFDAATKVPLAEYDHEMVCTEPYGGDDSYVATEDWDDEGEEQDWAWACVPLPWPRLDADDILYSALEGDFPEDARERLDATGLQKLLDEWIAAQGDSRCYIADRTRVVVFPPTIPGCDGEEMMPLEGDLPAPGGSDGTR